MIGQSYREADLNLLSVALDSITPLFFPLDHTHYDQWVSVCIHDLKTITVKFPLPHKELVLGFVVNTRGNAFSRISLDQAQDHSNNKSKSMARYIDFVSQEDKEYLRNVEH